METTFEKIRVEVKNHFAHITLNNLPQNYLTHQLMGEICDALELVTNEPELSGLLFTSAGGNFSSGFDYSEHSREIVFSITDRFRSLCDFLLNLDCPSFAIVEGKVRNWACDLLFFIDVVIAEANTSFQYDNILTGAFSPAGTIFLQDALGYKQALKMLMEAPEFTASEAQDIGLVSTVATREELVGELKKTISVATSKSGPVLSLTLRNLRKRKSELFTSFADEMFSEYLNILADLEDYAEGLQAWVEKRAPSWKNK